MRKTAVILLIVLGSFSLMNAQLPDGVIAPNWTMTDINGNPHTLYDYLDAGKVVIIDVSATWCYPCWNYHNSHALRDVYNNYGPAGTDEIMVFFIEGDGSTTLDDLNGTGSNTQGDWVTGTPYPIINSTAINNAYDIEYFPTIYMICPDRVISEIGQKTAAEIYTLSLTCPELTTDVNNARIFEAIEPSGDYCQGTVRPKLKIQNYGTSNLTSLEVVSVIDGIPADTFLWTGNLVMYDTEIVQADETAVLNNGNHSFEFIIQNPNGVPDENTGDNTASLIFSTNSQGTVVTVKIKTDNNPSQTSWEITNSSGVVASGGSFTNANYLYQETVCLYEDSCYTFTVYDSGNNGLTGTTYGLIYWGGTIASFGPGAFTGSQIDLPFCLIGTEITESMNHEQIKLYPVPASAFFYVEGIGESDITDNNLIITDIFGRRIKADVEYLGGGILKVNTTSLLAGTYIFVCDTGKNRYKERFVIVK
ncbi:MAG: hypothetical protein ABIJ16_10865 [Bacteroidota bacterium]